jgi:hypothetical protein
LLTVVGYTHASRVIPLVNCNDAASFTVTRALVPLNVNALPYLPEVVHVALPIVPLFPLPDTSVTPVPPPSLKEYAATSPTLGAASTVTTKFVPTKPHTPTKNHPIAATRLIRRMQASPSPPRRLMQITRRWRPFLSMDDICFALSSYWRFNFGATSMIGAHLQA